jgi:hypothetical protein
LQVKKFIRYTTKNPFFVRAIDQFLSRNCAKFNSDEEHKLEYTELFREYEELVDKSIDLFISKTRGCTEASLVKALEEGGHDDFVSALTAKASYENFVIAMKEKRVTSLQEVFGGIHENVEDKDSKK